MATTRQSGGDWESSAPEQLDDAFAVLRRLPATAVAWWICGATPMVLVVLFFCVDQLGTRRGPPEPAGWAAALAAGFVWLKVAGAFFAREVWRQRLPDGGLPALDWGGWFRRTGALLVISAVWLPLLALSVPLVFPVGIMVAIGQHVTAVAYTQDLGGRPMASMVRLAVRHAFREVLGGHLAMLMMAVTAVMAWGSVFVLGLLIPFVIKLLSGVESEFTRSPLAVALSPVYLCATSAITWMLVSPYHRVVHVLGAFRALSRRTGDDLLARLHGLRVLLVAGLWLMAGVLAGPAAAAELESEVPAVAPLARVEPVVLGDAIEATMDHRDYRWWQPEESSAPQKHQANRIWEALKRVGSSAQAALRSIRELWGEAGRFLKRWLGGNGEAGPGAADSGGWFGGRSGRLLAVLGVVIAGVVLLAVVVRGLRRRRHTPAESTTGAMSAGINLADETTLASALPESEWLVLARREQEAGDWRLAVRAVFLAMLASLGERRLIDIARSKSNRDYTAELRRRTVAGPAEVEVFAESVGLFERAWYGWHDAGPDWVHTLLQNHQRLSAHDRG